MRIRPIVRISILLAAAFTGCDSLTTPESTSEEIRIVVVPESGSPQNDSTLTTGDTIAYDVFQVTEGAFVVPRAQTWFASDTSIVRVLNDRTGRFFVRRLGTDTIKVEAEIETNAAGNVTITGQRTIRVTQELFFGPLSPTTVAFRDPLAVSAPPEQPLGPNTQVLLAADPASGDLTVIPGIVTGRTGNTGLTVVVPAGFTTSPVGLTDIQPDARTLISRRMIARAANDNDLDPFDRADSTAIPIPFTDILSLHDSLDVDTYSFTLNEVTTLRFFIAWNVPSNLDLRLETFDLLERRVVVFESDDKNTSNEGPRTATLNPNRYELTVFHRGYVGPTTYLILVEVQ